jgi:hypothetical protein
VETLQRPELRADFGSRLERTMAPPVTTLDLRRLGRDQTVQPDAAKEVKARDIEARGIEAGDIEAGDTDDTDGAASVGRGPGTLRPREVPRAISITPRIVARQTLAGSGDRLLADARDACRRDGVAATRRELLMRVARKVGLPQAEVARGLGGTLRREAVAQGGYAPRRGRDPISRLATAILGTREREVFLARRMARPDDMAALHALAACLGLSVERVYELEASARRKLARALR